MNEEYPASIERDPRFPSGAWTGFFLQSWLPGRQPTDVELTWSDGVMTGSGSDRVGPYTVAGEFRHHGKVAAEFTRVVSKDGQTLSVTISASDSAGVPSRTVLVYERLVT